MTHIWRTFLGGADKDAPEAPTAVPKVWKYQ
jgi:hypothetical protein